MKKCVKCGKELVNRGGAAKYCEPCRILRNKEHDRQSELRKQQRRKETIGDRFCERCKTTQIKSSKRVLYCNDCAPIVTKEVQRYNKRKSTIVNRRRGRKKLDVNFKSVNPNGRFLIPSQFNTISNISSNSYTQRFKGGWVSVLKRYNKLNELKEYIISEYIKWSNIENSITVGDFYKEIDISGTLMDSIIMGDELRERAGFKKRFLTKEEEGEEFLRVVALSFKLPTATEFKKLSEINIYTLAKKLNISGDVYIGLLEFYRVEKNRIDELRFRMAETKSIAAREQRLGVFKLTTEELIEDFKRTFDAYVKKHGTTPTVEVYKKISVSGLTTISSRLKMSFTEIADHLGYDVDSSGSPTELVVLNNVKNILQSKYTPQAKFDWLRSDLNYMLQCDGYFKKHNLIVEFDGRQHYEMVLLFGQHAFERTQLNDNVKNTLIPQNNLTLVRITYDEPYWDEQFLRMKLYEGGITPSGSEIVYDSLDVKSLHNLKHVI